MLRQRKFGKTVEVTLEHTRQYISWCNISHYVDVNDNMNLIKTKLLFYPIEFCELCKRLYLKQICMDLHISLLDCDQHSHKYINAINLNFFISFLLSVWIIIYCKWIGENCKSREKTLNNISSDDWFRYFERLLNTTNPLEQQHKETVKEYMNWHDRECLECRQENNEVLDKSITVEEVNREMANLSLNKSLGINEIKMKLF